MAVIVIYSPYSQGCKEGGANFRQGRGTTRAGHIHVMVVLVLLKTILFSLLAQVK